MMNTVMEYAPYVMATMAAMIVFLNAVAPLTKTEWDNRVLKGLVWLHDLMLKMLLPQHTMVVKQPTE